MAEEFQLARLGCAAPPSIETTMLLTSLALALLPHAPQTTQIEGPVNLGWESRFDAQIAGDEFFEDVVIAGGVAFATGSSGLSDSACLTIATDVSTGATLWTSRYDGSSGRQDAGRVVCVTDSVVVVGGLTDDNIQSGFRGLLLGLDRSSGAELWSLPIGQISSPFGFWSTACIELELDPSGTTVYALAREEFWDDTGYSSVFTDKVLAVTVATGAIQWCEPTTGVSTAEAMALSPDGSQLVIGGLELISDPYGGFSAVRSSVMAVQTSDGSTLWSQTLLSNVFLGQFLGGFDTAFSGTGQELLVLGPGPGPQGSRLFRLDPLDGSSVWSFDQPGLGLDRLSLTGAGHALAAGTLNGQGRVLSLSTVDGALDWEQSGPTASRVNDLELDHAGGTFVVAYGDGLDAPSTWRFEARDTASGMVTWSSTVGAGDLSEDHVDALAIDPVAGVCVAAGTLYSFDAASQGVLREHNLSSGALQGDVRYDALVSGDQKVADTALSADGQIHFSAGNSGALSSNPFSTTIERRGGWVAAHAAESGELQWSRALGGPVPRDFTVDHLALGAAPGTIAVAGRYDPEQTHVSLLDAGSGAQLWQTPLDNHVEQYDLAGDLAAVPAAGLILVATYRGLETTVVALDATTGAEVWNTPFQPTDSNHPPMLQVSPDGSRAYLIASNYISGGNKGDVAVACLETANGSVLWFQLYDWDGQQPAWDSDFAKDSALSPDGTALYVFGQTQPDGTYMTSASVWIKIDAQNGFPIWYAVDETEPGEGLSPRRVALSPDGTRLYGLSTLWRDFGGGDFDVQVNAHDTDSGQLVWSSSWFTGYQEQFNGFAIGVTPDGSAVLAAAGTGNAQLNPQGLTVGFDALSGEPIWNSVLDGVGPRDEETRAIQFTPDGRRALVASQSSLNPAHRDLVLQELLLPSLTGVPAELSATSGGTHSFALSGGVAQAGQNAFLLGSLAGTTPGLPLAPNLSLPLVFDGYTNFTLLNFNTPPLANTLSVLDAAGHSSASVTLAPGAFPSLVGKTLHHAWVGFSISGFSFVSNPATLEIVP